MKVGISSGTNSYTLTLIPESEREQAFLKDFASTLSRAHVISHRGFEYMAADVAFHIQPMPSRG